MAHPGAELFGSDRMLLESAIGVRESGERVVVALPNGGPLVDALRSEGIEVVILPMLVLRKSLLKPRAWGILLRDTFRSLGSAWRLIRRLRPSAVYVSTITIPLWPLVARLRSVPNVVSHIHEAEASGSRLVNRVLYVPHLAAHRVLVNSEFSMQTIASALPSLQRTATVVYNGVASPQRPEPPRDRISGPLRVLYLGRLSPRKGPDLILDAATQLAEEGAAVEVTLLGSVFPGYEWYEEELRAAAESNPAVAVEFAGFQPDIWPSLAASDVLIVPSRLDEPFGNTAVEGILALRPVVASDTSGLREAAGPYATAQLVVPDESRPLAEALRSIVAAWPRLVSEVASARNQALARHEPGVYRDAVRSAVLPQSEHLAS